MRNVQRQVHPIHFEDFSGQQFERLCFAYLVRRNPGSDVNWYGQLGSDRGRDIVCTMSNGARVVAQCANFRRLPIRKVHEDLVKITTGSLGTTCHFSLICGGSVSADQKDKIIREATQLGFTSASVLSGPEFEEHLRIHTPELLRRFVGGETFPELPEELVVFSQAASELSDEKIVEALSVAFDRPAFRTHFHQESSLPRFKEAIAETIRTLNTGQTPQGTQLPSRHQISDSAIRGKFGQLVGLLVTLRSAFDDFIRNGMIKPCGCNVPDCPVFFIKPQAAYELDRQRSEILRLVHELNRRFDPHFY